MVSLSYYLTSNKEYFCVKEIKKYPYYSINIQISATARGQNVLQIYVYSWDFPLSKCHTLINFSFHFRAKTHFFETSHSCTGVMHFNKTLIGQ